MRLQNFDRTVTFSLQRLLLGLLKMIVLLVVIYMTLYLFVPTLTDGKQGLAPWAISASAWWETYAYKNPLLPFGVNPYLMLLLPVIALQLLASVTGGLIDGSRRHAESLLVPAKKQLRTIFLTAGILIVLLVLHYTISRGLATLYQSWAYQLPLPNMNLTSPIDPSLPGQYTPYCALLVGIIYLLTKKCMIYKRTRNQSHSVTVLAPTPQL